MAAGKGKEGQVRVFDGPPPAVIDAFFAEQLPFDDGLFIAAAVIG